MATIKSIEQKAKAYDEAIERAKSLLSGNKLGNAWIYKLLPELKESEDVLIKMYVESVQSALEEFNKKVDESVEHIVRNYVTPPIKGEITKGKVRWRGLSLAWATTDNGTAFIGVKQRNTLITLDGNKYRLNTQN